MAKKNVELSLTESFVKHKRNLVLLCAIIAVIGAAAPESVKLPLVTVDQGIPAPVAFGFLLLALLYFFASYMLELIAVHARNLEIQRTAEHDSISSRLEDTIKPMESGIIAVSHLCSELQSAIDHYRMQFSDNKASLVIGRFSDEVERIISTMQDVEEKISVDNVHGFHTVLAQLGHMDQKVGSAISSITSEYDKAGGDNSSITRKQKEILDKLEVVKVIGKNLSEKFGRLSRLIYPSQRIGYGVLDVFVPALLSILALAVCIDGAFHNSKIAKSIIPPLKAIEQPQDCPVAMPKVGTQSTENLDFPSTKG